MDYVTAFLIGGAICAIVQVIMDNTKLLPGRIMVGLVCAGAILSFFGLYEPFADWAKSGASVPLIGFGHLLFKGVKEAVDKQASIYGKRFGNGGGVSAAVAQCMREAGADPDKFNIEKCSGAAECKKALTLLKVGKLPADFIEGMVCEGGCVGGPSRHRSGKNPVLAAKDRDKLLAEADDRNVSDNLSKYDLTAFSMHK